MSVDLNYFAGLMDSDGWVGKCERRLMCVIANTDKRPLEILHQTYGGGLLLPSRENRSTNHAGNGKYLTTKKAQYCANCCALVS